MRTCGYQHCSQSIGPDARQLYCCRAHKERARQSRATEQRSCAWCSREFACHHRSRGAFCGPGCRWARARLQAVRADDQRRPDDPRAMDLRFGYVSEHITGTMRQDVVDALHLDPCAYCGAPADTLDHIEATRLGGAHDLSNLAAACASCNSRKQTVPLLQFLLAGMILAELEWPLEQLARLTAFDPTRRDRIARARQRSRSRRPKGAGVSL